MELIGWTTARFAKLSLTELAQTICENLPWKAPNGQLKVKACLALLEQLAGAALVRLPAKRVQAPYRAGRFRAQPLPPVEIAAALAELRPVRVEPVAKGEQALWDATMAAHHAMGFRRAFGAHQRYWIHGRLGGQAVILGGCCSGRRPGRLCAGIAIWDGGDSSGNASATGSSPTVAF